ncbi:hypothetical protein ABW19_dt0210376 [Dactylella cylindrospora]|nr:hypothetical protein ABW19_dt0210376 [Dactylella cylindrospora]
MEEHTAAVAAISQKMSNLYARKVPYRIYHGSRNAIRLDAINHDQMIDTSNLRNVLKVDILSKTALVEPNVPMDRLVEATLLYGLVPPVVMEFPGITTGGGYAGTSAESSSFRHGFFDRTIDSVEIVLANGEVVTASRRERSDLLHGAASSYGTLGVVTLLEVQLVPAKPYVELTYHLVETAGEMVPKIEELSRDPTNDYIDGIMYSKSVGLIILGRMIDEPASGMQVNGFTAPRDPWFYLHAEKVLKRIQSSKSTTYVDATPIFDYLFRYDRGVFWTGKYAFRYFLTPFNRITRWLLDYFMHTRIAYRALHKSGLADMYVIQDVAVRYDGAEEFIEYLDQDFGYYPLWLCPLKTRGGNCDYSHGLLAGALDNPTKGIPDYLLNFGVWGPGPWGRRKFVEMNRRLEKKVESLGGMKALYAQAYYTEEEFWNIYSREEYDALRGKYHASHLPNVFEKTRRDWVAEQRRMEESWVVWLMAMFWSIWPLGGLYGVYTVLIGRDNYLPRPSFLRTGSKLKSKDE